MSISDPILEAIKNQRHAIICNGENFDLSVDSTSGRLLYRPLIAAEELHRQGYAVLRFSRSSGLQVHELNQLESRKAETVNRFLKRFGLDTFLHSNKIDPTEVVCIFRALRNLLCNENELKIALIVDYIPHLASNPEHGNSVEERIVNEALNEMASLPVVFKNGHKVILYTFTDPNSPLLKQYFPVKYAFPTLEEYERFFEIAMRRSDFAKLSITPKEAARLARGLSLRQLVELLRESKSKEQSLTIESLTNEKARLIDRLSEGTLTLLPTDVSLDDDIAGLEVPKRVLKQFAKLLCQNSKSSPMRILFAGPPGTGKSTIVKALANEASWNLVELSDSIKSKWVGESEARLDRALELIRALAPVVLFVDEIDQSVPTRSANSNDGGVAAHYLKTLMKFIANDDLRGKVLIVAASNTPQNLDPALLDRFAEGIIPLLEATPREIAAILPKVEKRVTGKETLLSEDDTLLEAAEILYKKGVSPRQLFPVINKALVINGKGQLSSIDVLRAARYFRGGGNPIAAAFSSLSAIQLTSDESYFPWADSPTSYPYPWYLEGVINADGTIKEVELRKKIAQFSNNAGY